MLYSIFTLHMIERIMQKNDKIFVAGHQGLVGSAIVRLLQKQSYSNIITRTRDQLDLLNQAYVEDFFLSEKFIIHQNYAIAWVWCIYLI